MAFKVLIADDHLEILHILRARLESESPLEVCCEASNGAEAVAKAQEIRPDVIVLDLAMPIMNGFDAAREINKSLPGTAVILFTLTDIPEVRVQAAKAGIRQVVSKRDGVKALIAAIETTLKERAEGGLTALHNTVTPIASIDPQAAFSSESLADPSKKRIKAS